MIADLAFYKYYPISRYQMNARNRKARLETVIAPPSYIEWNPFFSFQVRFGGNFNHNELLKKENWKTTVLKCLFDN